jgi:putative hydrolase of the HAD superfamily
VDRGYWDGYYATLLRELGLNDAELKQELVSLVQTSSNWSLLADGAEWVLRQLAREYRLGIISNSDGGISELLVRLGIRELFDCIIDSGIVGHEKPDSRIFLAAMKGMAVAAPQAIYLGDLYSVDYLGAKAVGMQAILMDAAGVYRDKPVPRIESIRQLPEMLECLTVAHRQRT